MLPRIVRSRARYCFHRVAGIGNVGYKSYNNTRLFSATPKTALVTGGNRGLSICLHSF